MQPVRLQSADEQNLVSPPRQPLCKMEHSDLHAFGQGSELAMPSACGDFDFFVGDPYVKSSDVMRGVPFCPSMFPIKTRCEAMEGFKNFIHFVEGDVAPMLPTDPFWHLEYTTVHVQCLDPAFSIGNLLLTMLEEEKDAIVLKAWLGVCNAMCACSPAHQYIKCVGIDSGQALVSNCICDCVSQKV